MEESQKDFITLLKAYALLVKDGVPELFVLVGDGASRKQLQALAYELGIAYCIVFVGFQPNPHAWIRGIRLMVFSSKMEGVPRASGGACCGAGCR
nr:glycosyltransferase [Ralstonia sp. UBA689]